MSSASKECTPPTPPPPAPHLVPRAVYELLLAEGAPGAGGDEPGALHGAGRGKGPAGAALGLAGGGANTTGGGGGVCEGGRHLSSCTNEMHPHAPITPGRACAGPAPHPPTPHTHLVLHGSAGPPPPHPPTPHTHPPGPSRQSRRACRASPGASAGRRRAAWAQTSPAAARAAALGGGGQRAVPRFFGVREGCQRTDGQRIEVCAGTLVIHTAGRRGGRTLLEGTRPLSRTAARPAASGAGAAAPPAAAGLGFLLQMSGTANVLGLTGPALNDVKS